MAERLSNVLMQTAEVEPTPDKVFRLNQVMQPTAIDNAKTSYSEPVVGLKKRGLWEQTKMFLGEQAKAVARGIERIPAYPQSMMQIAFDNVRNVAKNQMIKDGNVFGRSDKEFESRTPEAQARINSNKQFIYKMDFAIDTAKRLEDEWLNRAETGWTARNPQVWRGEFMENPSWTRAFALGFESTPILGIAAATTVLTKSPAVGASLIGTMEAAPMYREMRENGFSTEEASSMFGVNTAVMSALESLPLSGFLKGGSLGVRTLRGVVQEGLIEEPAQTLWMNAVEKIGWNDTKDLYEGLVESVIAGGISGGVIGAASPSRVVKTDEAIKRAREAGIDIEKATTSVRKVIEENHEKIIDKINEKATDLVSAEQPKDDDVRSELRKIVMDLQADVSDIELAERNADLIVERYVAEAKARSRAEGREISPVDLFNEENVEVQKVDDSADVIGLSQGEVGTRPEDFKTAEEYVASKKNKYRGVHQAPTREHSDIYGALHEIDKTYPSDIYTDDNAWRYYGNGNMKDKAMDMNSLKIIRSVRGNPDADITIYRSVPKGTQKEINPGDWVSINKQYVRQHGERFNEGQEIIEKKVKAGDIFTEGNSIHEFGYDPMVGGLKTDAQLTAEWEAAHAGKGMTLNQSATPVDTKSENFKKWFGDSKVVDAEGKPLVVYHGTNADFDTFEVGRAGSNSNVFGSWEAKRAGIFFAQDKALAQEFATQGERSGGKVMEVYLRIEEPIDLTQGFSDAVINALEEKGLNRRYFEKLSPWKIWEAFDHENDGPKIVAVLKELGYDGAKISDVSSGDVADTTSWVVFDNTQIKSVNNSGAFDPASPNIFYQSATVSSLGFYSKAEQIITEKVPNSVDATQLINTLKNNGVKPEEISQLGLDTLTGKVSKADLLTLIKANQVPLEEKVLGDISTPESLQASLSEFTKTFGPDKGSRYWVTNIGRADFGIDEIGGKFRATVTPATREGFKDVGTFDTFDEALKALSKETAKVPSSQTKFSQYQLPGGENYREVLIKLPKQTKLSNEDTIRMAEISGIRPPYRTPEEQAFIDDYLRKNKLESEQQFRSSHFDDPNIIVHARINDRIVDGKKVLFIEEIQSDWHQKGRKEGYKNSDERAKIEAELKSIYKRMDEAPKGKAYDNVADLKRERELNNKLNALDVAPPDAPFKKTWHELMFKRLLDKAVNEGYDAVAWTTGEQQAERYDLSKQIDSLSYDDKNVLQAYNKEGRVVIGKTVPESELADTIGKEAAEKLINQKANSDGEKHLSNADLKVGGEGMKGFYDQMLPSFVNKYTKKWGGKVGESKVETGEKKRFLDWVAEQGYSKEELTPENKQKIFDDYNAIRNYEKVHSLDITPAMRESIQSEGQPLFQDGQTTPRAMVEMTDKKKVISLFEKADKSSIIHEFGHIWLKSMHDYIQSGKADAEYIQHFETMKAWLGITDINAPLTVAQQEKFAEGIERFVAEGKAPTSRLLKAFNAFKQWMKDIYNSLPGDEIPPDVKDFFGRMFGAEKPSLPDERLGGRIRRGIEDFNIRLKEINAIVEKIAGGPIKEYLDLWKLKDMLPRVQADAIRRIRQEQDALIQAIVKDGLTVKEVDDYLHALHARERNAKMNALRREKGQTEKDGLSGMLDAEADAILAKEKPEYKKYVAMAKQMSENLLNFEVAEGLIKQEEADAIRQAYQNYVPLYREMDEDHTGIGAGVDIRGKEIKRAKGSERRVLSPLGNLFAQREKAFTRALKNKIGQTVIKLVEEYPEMEFLFKIEAQKYIPRFNDKGELQFLDPKFMPAQNVIGTKVDGKQYFITVNDKGVADALKNTNLARVAPMLQNFRTVIGFWSSMKTRWNPEFLITNFQRDLGEGLINLGVEAGQLGDKGKGLRVEIAKNIFKSQKRIFRYLRGNKDNDLIVDEFFKLGGDTGHFWVVTAKETEKSLYDLEKQVKGVGAERIKNPARAALQFIDDINSMVELGVRLSTYEALVRRGFSKERAVQSAADLTVNFSRQGEWSPMLKTAYAFINPAIQGTSKVMRSIGSQQGRKQVLGAITGLVLLGFLVRALSKLIDDDEDKLINDYTKNHKIAFSIGNGDHLTLWSMPYGFTTFYAMGNNLAEAAFGDKTFMEGMKQSFITAVDSFSPFGTTLNDLTPTLIKPISDIQNNKGWHGGKIHPDQIFDRTPEPNNQQYFDSASGAWILAAKMLNRMSGGDDDTAGLIDISPNDYQYLWDNFLGGPIEFVVSTVEAGARGVNGEFDVNKTPFVRKFYRSGEVRKFSYSMIYDTLDIVGRKKISELQKQRFLDAVELGEAEQVYDEDIKKNKDKASGFRRDFFKAYYGIDGEINSPEAKATIRTMDSDDKKMFLKTYKNLK